jgi:hypothetical protein
MLTDSKDIYHEITHDNTRGIANFSAWAWKVDSYFGATI